MCLCCIFLSLFWLSLCKIFFIYFLSCPIVINYIVKKNTGIKNFDGSKCNSDEWWNNKKCRCESKNVIYVKKIMFADLLHIIVKMKNIQQLLCMIQRLCMIKLKNHKMKMWKLSRTTKQKLFQQILMKRNATCKNATFLYFTSIFISY